MIPRLAAGAFRGPHGKGAIQRVVPRTFKSSGPLCLLSCAAWRPVDDRRMDNWKPDPLSVNKVIKSGAVGHGTPNAGDEPCTHAQRAGVSPTGHTTGDLIRRLAALNKRSFGLEAGWSLRQPNSNGHRGPRDAEIYASGTTLAAPRLEAADIRQVGCKSRHWLFAEKDKTMRYAICYATLITAGFAAAKGQEARNVTTKPATKPNVLTVPELFALADQALSMERPVRGVDRYWLVAVAMVESGGNPNIKGDKGKALGLHQFHVPAWQDCWGKDTTRPRNDALSSFRAAIIYAGLYDNRIGHDWSPAGVRAARSSRHHLGHYYLEDKKYINRVERQYKELVSEYGGK